MKRNLLKIFVLGLVFIFFNETASAGIVADVYEGIATEPTQLMNNVELIGCDLGQWKAVAQQVIQLEHEVEMITNQLTNLEKLSEDPLSAVSMVNSLSKLGDIVQAGQVLSYAASNIDSKYSDLYPGYSTYVSEDLTSDVMQQKYKDWSQANMDSVKDVLKEANLQDVTMSSEQDRLSALETMSQTVDGRLQAIQAGNLIGIEEAKSLQRLRKLVADNTQLQANYMAKTQDGQDLDDAKWKQQTQAEETNTTDGENILDDSF
jgi:type IV secretion system protein TrbJ